MTEHLTTTTPFFSARTALGLSAGLAASLILTFFYNKPGGLTPQISIMLAMLVSGFFEPKRAAGLGAVIGLFAGLALSMKIVLDTTPKIGVSELVGSYLLAGLTVPYSMLFHAFIGLALGTVARLYRRGALL